MNNLKMKNKIILAASELLQVYTLNRVTMDRLARQCHLRKSTLYYYFHDKQTIVTRVLEHFRVNIIPSAVADIRRKINHDNDKLFACYCDFFFKQGRLIIHLLVEVEHEPWLAEPLQKVIYALSMNNLLYANRIALVDVLAYSIGHVLLSDVDFVLAQQIEISE